MEIFTEILLATFEAIKYALPAAIVVIAIRLMQNGQLKRAQLELKQQSKVAIVKESLPMRLAAYERSVLFLERIGPQELLLRMPPGQRPAVAYHAELTQAIRDEFSHNLAQQVYIGLQGWAGLVGAKEQMLSIINQALKDVGEDASALVLARKIVEHCASLTELGTQRATILLKSEIQALFRS